MQLPAGSNIPLRNSFVAAVSRFQVSRFPGFQVSGDFRFPQVQPPLPSPRANGPDLARTQVPGPRLEYNPSPASRPHKPVVHSKGEYYERVALHAVAANNRPVASLVLVSLAFLLPSAPSLGRVRHIARFWPSHSIRCELNEHPCFAPLFGND